MKEQPTRIFSRLRARFRASVQAARERRQRQAQAAEKLKPLSVLPTRPGSLLHL